MLRGIELGSAAVVAVAAVASLGFLLTGPGLIAGHDILFETVRLVEYRTALPDQIVPRLAPDLYHGYGSPVFVFYPPLFLLLTSVVDLLLRDLTISVKIVVTLLAVVSALFMQTSLRRMTGPLAAAAGALVWVLAPYKFTDLYARNAYAEYTALCLLPVAFHFLFSVVTDEGTTRGPRIGLFASVLLLGVAHNITFLLALPLILLTAVYLGAVRSRPRAVVAGVLPVVGGACAAAFFLLPAFLHRDLVRMEDLTTGKFEVTANFPAFGETFLTGPGFLYESPIPLLICAAAGLRWLRRRRSLADDPLGPLAIGLFSVALVLMLPVSAPLWHAIPLAPYIQFPWRLLVLASLATSWAAAYALDGIAPRQRDLVPALALLLAVALGGVHLLKHRGAQRFDPTQVTPEVILAGGLPATVGHEYLPRVADRLNPEVSERAQSTAEAAATGARVRSDRYRRCTDSAVQSRVEFQLLNFPYWHAAAGGRGIELPPDAPTLVVELPPGERCAEVRLGFSGIQLGGMLVSVLAVVGFAATLLRRGR